MSVPNPYAAPAADVNAPLAPRGEQLPLAGRGARLGAQLLDFLVGLAPGGLLMAGTIMMIVNTAHARTPTPATSAVAFGLIGVGSLGALALAIFQIYRLTTTGQTLGKKWMNVRVVKQDGAPVTFATVFLLRMLVPGLLTIIPYLGLGFFLVDTLFVFREDRRCIHDMIAATKVVEVPLL